MAQISFCAKARVYSQRRQNSIDEHRGRADKKCSRLAHQEHRSQAQALKIRLILSERSKLLPVVCDGVQLNIDIPSLKALADKIFLKSAIQQHIAGVEIRN